MAASAKKTTSVAKKTSSQAIPKNVSQTKTNKALKVEKTSIKNVSKESQVGLKKISVEKNAPSKLSVLGKSSSFKGGSTGFSLSQSSMKKSASTENFTTAKSKVTVPPSKTAIKGGLQQKNAQNMPAKSVTGTIANIKPGKEHYTKENMNRRQEVLRQLRAKLGNNLSTVEKSTKTGRGAVVPSGPAESADSVKAGFNSLSMSQMETHIQTFTLRFVDLVICCMVVDNYLFGTLILLASLAEIIIGWVYIEQCTSEPILPYVLMVNGVLNIIEVHMRNLANQRLIDYFVMSIFRLMAFFSLVYLMIILLTIDESMTIYNLPDDAIYISNKGIIYCSKVLYYFSYYLSVIAGSLILGLSLYTIFIIAYMNYQLGGRRIHGSRISSIGPSSKGSSKGSSASSGPLGSLSFSQIDSQVAKKKNSKK